jgi:ParB/RepB/Spo0J family partition protein
MAGEIRAIGIEKLLAHPGNPNVMSYTKFKKLVSNIERTGLYEPIVVRPHPKEKDMFEIINGHHRVKAISQLGYKEANCIVWNVDDAETAILLTTLNRLRGSDIASKKIELLRQLNERMKTAQLAKLLPQTAKQIERLIALKEKAEEKVFRIRYKPAAVTQVFFVTGEQNEIIEKALSSAENRAPSNRQTKAQRRAAAITAVSEHYSASLQAVKNAAGPKNAGLLNGAIMV